jgi:putative transcriptional regulator
MAIVKVTPEMVANAVGATDWRAVDAQSDENIARNVALDPDAAPILTDGQIAAAIARGVRKRLGLSQADFAMRFRVPLGTLRDWEQGRRQPDAPALAYLRVIAREPELVARALAGG